MNAAVRLMGAAAALLVAGAWTAQAQDTSTTRIGIHKDYTGTAGGSLVTPSTTYMPDTIVGPIYYTPASATTCSTVDVNAANAVSIKTDLYNSGTMISPDSAKFIALCAVPGQIGSGEMNVANGRTNYAIDIIPNGKKTHTKVIVDANTGAVLSTKQFGGARGVTGWVRESLEHRQNTNPTPNDTMPQFHR
jgi:Peptidase propeptide and YPEB domain